MKDREVNHHKLLEVPDVYDDTDMRHDFVTRIQDGLFRIPYPGYPRERYTVEQAPDAVTIPDGPWSTEGAHAQPTPEEQKLLALHYQLDAWGRPLHPWLPDMVRPTSLGVVTGRGAYWQWGPNFAADAVVITDEADPHLLLIQRNDTGRWALPGGFIDLGDVSVEAAARREAREETGCLLEAEPGTLVYQGVVADSRTTAHAWAETSAVLFRPKKRSHVKGSDDAMRATWVPLCGAPHILFGSHAQLVRRAQLTMKEGRK